MEPSVVSHWIQNPKDKVYADFYDIFCDTLSSEKYRKNQVANSKCQKILFKFDIPYPPPSQPKFTFLDLFAGIGGFRMAMQKLGGQCVFSSEWDLAAQKTYESNFGEIPFGDITKQEVKDMIPSGFDVLCAGFPCQAFSIAGYQEGFMDKKGRGGLFFDIAKILEKHKPQCILLENVKNLKAHDDGKTFKIIQDTLVSLGYHVKTEILNTMDYGNCPQNRERIFIVGFLKLETMQKFKFPHKIKLKRTIHDCLSNEAEQRYYYPSDSTLGKQLDKEIQRRDTLYQWRRIYVRENKNNVCPTLTANMGMGGHNVPLVRDSKGIRKLTPRECANFQGYPSKYILPKIADSLLYKQFGNTVSIPVVQRVAHAIRKAMND